jgi:hypothetical protein
MDAATVMTVAASSSGDEGFRSVAYLLDGTVVPPGSGSAAIAALQRAFQEQAAAGTGSGLDEWLKILADAGLQVFPDADGPAGPRRRAELNAIAAHRARLAARDGILEFSLLADDLPPMTYPPLADSLYLAVPGRDPSDAEFLGTARRWTRMLLTGLPGMGKSTALEQLAARWAADDDAPVPVLVPLRDIARRHPRQSTDITLPVLIEAATAAAPEQERAPLRRALEQAAATGDAVLLLDGLDETQDRRAVVADCLAAVARDLPAETGIVLATRDSGLAAAEKLNMPEARLTEPLQLDTVLVRLLEHIAARRVLEADRDQWVQQRRQQLEEIRGSHPDLWRIPLFAVLFTLLTARPDPRALPAGRVRRDRPCSHRRARRLPSRNGDPARRGDAGGVLGTGAGRSKRTGPRHRGVLGRARRRVRRFPGDGRHRAAQSGLRRGGRGDVGRPPDPPDQRRVDPRRARR